jgi:preprotein translocase subunit SecA
VRKNVLKYDEVMNEQRKVIYARRTQILNGEDLKEDAIAYLQEISRELVGTFCDSDVESDWDLDGLLSETNTYWPIEVDVSDLKKFSDIDQLENFVIDKAVDFYSRREIELGPENMREVERQVMLRILDQRWRQHLYEMDYLREGIHLRGIGQKDPVSEWQREGFDMFSAMLESTHRDFVKYAMHAEVVVREQKPADTSLVSYSSSENDAISPNAPSGNTDARMTTDKAQRIKSAEEKIGRNDLCHCGSNKKFKHCHGR